MHKGQDQVNFVEVYLLVIASPIKPLDIALSNCAGVQVT